MNCAWLLVGYNFYPYYTLKSNYYGINILNLKCFVKGIS